MIVNQDPQTPDHELDDATSVQSRRTLLRRSLLGITGIGLASLLAACGDEDDDEDGENEVETIESEGEDVVDKVEEEVDDAVDEEEG